MTAIRIDARARLLAALAASTIFSGAALGPCFAAGNPAASFGTATPIKHIVIIFQENVSFDHYFGTYPKAANNGDGPAFTPVDPTPTPNGLTGGLIGQNPNFAQPFRLTPAEAYTCDQDHGYTDEEKAADGGLMDNFKVVSRNSVGCKADGSTVMGYYDGNTVTALWNYAQNFAMSDNSFNSIFGPSTPGALNLISGQTHGSKLFTHVTGTPVPLSPAPGTTLGSNFIGTDGLGSVIGDPDPLIDDCSPVGTAASPRTLIEISPTNKNVGDLLNAKNISWGWFNGGFRLTAPGVCGASHIGHPNVPNTTVNNPGGAFNIHSVVTDYVPHHQPFQYYASTANPHHLPPSSPSQIGLQSDQANHQYDLADFFSALQNHTLPAVSFLKPPAYQDGHPGNSDPISEQTFLVQTINQLMQSQEWSDMAIIIAYDDSDGWYDHVLGPIVNPSNTATGTPPVDALAGPGNCGTPVAGAFQARCGYGPRTPLLAISPFAKVNYVDHTVTDQSSILRFIEDNWQLGRIDGNSPVAGQQSFDQLAGSLENLFDSEAESGRSRRLLLDPASGN